MYSICRHHFQQHYINPELQEDVLAAAKEIGVHDFIMNLPDNYDFDVKERGVCCLLDNVN
jgi:ABC-type bacteriocin/lantibiotic exporter with double-glycine peptidase domain